jgi:large subunit ribosomal protein L17
VVSKLFDTLAPRFAERAGGYTRIIRLGFRDGDGARMAILELVGSEYKPAKAEEKKGKKGKKEKRAKEEGSAIEPEKKKRAAAE